MTHPEDNALLRAAKAHAEYCEQSRDAIQVAAGLIACAGILLGAFLVLHFQVPM